MWGSAFMMIDAAATFSSRCLTLLVPGMGSIAGLRPNTHAKAIWPGVAPLLRAMTSRTEPGFASAPSPVFAAAGAAKPLPAGSRISYQSVSCGNDGAATTCVDSRSQSGFVISAAGSFILNETPPLLYRPEGTSPFAN